MSTRLDFDLPPNLEAGAPPEERGLPRDGVRLLVAHRSTGDLAHATFADLPAFLDPGDLVVINTSATRPAAIDGLTPSGERVVVHLSTRLDDGTWVVELRQATPAGSLRWPAGRPRPPIVALGEGASLRLLGPHLGSDRLSAALLDLPSGEAAWLAANGAPIRYRHVPHAWPLAAYQNVYALEPGSAEMPSAGRPFTAELVTRLVAGGVGVTPIVLHTGVSSLEAGEVPYPERVRVPPHTAARVELARRTGGRVVAVGTTVVRALESAVGERGTVEPLDGWTDLVITPERGVAVVDGLITGWHEPVSSHLALLEAVAGRDLLEASYRAALDEGYRWHEFGDAHLVLP